MKRFLLSVAVFFTATVSPTFAGYLIIRVLLESSDAVNPGEPGAIAPPKAAGSITPGPVRPKSPMPAFPGPGVTPPGVQPMTSTDAAEIDHSRSVVVLIPLESDLRMGRINPNPKILKGQNNPEYRKFVVYFYGEKLTTSLFENSSTIQTYTELLGVPAVKKTRETEVEDKYKAWLAGKTNPQLLYDAMFAALESGIIQDSMNTTEKGPITEKGALSYADELLAVANEKKLTLPDAAQRFVTAWATMRKAVQEPEPQPSDAESWRSRLDDAAKVKVDRHYAIIYWDASAVELSRRAKQLHNNFAGFFLWHATQGVVLPVPEKPLVAVLAKQGSVMHGLHKALDGMPMADAFYSPDHNLLVLSPERMDAVGQTFQRQNYQLFSSGLKRENILRNDFPKFDYTGEKGIRPDEVARASTLAIVEKLANDEAEIAAVSREGTRQLLYVTGVLPKHVTLPNWLTNGSVNFFTRPRGPAFITIGPDEKPHMHVALSTGYGVPNYMLQRHLKDLAAKKELPTNPVRLLENVLSDAYFDGIKNGDDPDPAPPKKPKKATAATAGPPGVGQGGLIPMGPPMGAVSPMAFGGVPPITSDAEDPVLLLRKQQQRLTIKAQATAWALYYYLAKYRAEELKQYISELNKLPRDLPIDGATATAVFIRVFKLSSSEDGQPDPARMKDFADKWMTHINTTPSVGYDIPISMPEPPKKDPGGLGIPMPPIPGKPMAK